MVFNIIIRNKDRKYAKLACLNPKVRIFVLKLYIYKCNDATFKITTKFGYSVGPDSPYKFRQRYSITKDMI